MKCKYVSIEDIKFLKKHLGETYLYDDIKLKLVGIIDEIYPFVLTSKECDNIINFIKTGKEKFYIKPYKYITYANKIFFKKYEVIME